MSDIAKRAGLNLKLPQIVKGRVSNPLRTERKERNLSIQNNHKLTLSQIPDKYSKRYALEK
jgi:hypothetical protein